jgi:hypothetical protein
MARLKDLGYTAIEMGLLMRVIGLTISRAGRE